MQSSRLAVMSLAAVAALTGTALGLRIVPPSPPAPPRPAGQALVSDPAEPPLGAEVSSGGSGLTVASSARGTALKLNTTGAWQGAAALTFKTGAPPMRLTLTLAGMPNYDLESLTVTGGNLSLAVGPVSSTPTTRYFDAAGREQAGPEFAAYTVTARRYAGEVDVEVRRAPGATLGKELTVSWRGDLGRGRGLECCG
jgi:hypothetical protein